ncbi:alpha/beta hydrolase [Coraliomargarita algicola]|uniref:Alpha/beta hydrolase n=1 Tax=Coraliomargarita algicola TaxID=3092156 RepID=A0ABZ0RJQ4_9BACT|nr:alpha/beta hydrolase [Coraliomargarita sp. J2-16]WPJ96302.1 alpha/beta hydrolase [Coraliomargarita sp. J2-16]
MIKPLTSLLLISVAICHFAAAADIRPDRELLYKEIDGVPLKLHLFEPADLKPTDQRPAIVFFFGGGWSGGTPKQFYQQARDMAELGLVAFSAEYRVRSRNKTTPFECVNDGKSAIRWVRAHAGELGIAPDRIVASGGSAGGHVAGATGVLSGYEEEGEDLAISSQPNLMILFNPVLDTTEAGFGAERFKPEQQTDLSLCHQVHPDIVPTIVFHGTADTTVPLENAERFTRLMQEAGNECVLVPAEGKGHGFFNGSFFRRRSDDVDYRLIFDRSVDFLRQHRYLSAL